MLIHALCFNKLSLLEQSYDFFIRTPEIGCNASEINGLVVVVGVVALMQQTDELQKESKSALFSLARLWLFLLGGLECAPLSCLILSYEFCALF